MLTALTTFLAALKAGKNLETAKAVAPYVAAGVPALTLLIALLVGWLHGDAVSRAVLVLVVLNEALVGGIGLYLIKIYVPMT
jgi:hypothetical protein